MLRAFARQEAKKAQRSATTGVRVYANQSDEDRAEARRRMVGRAEKYEALAAKLDAMFEEECRSPRSVLDLPCECENTHRSAYTYRGDGKLHCAQCDGLMPDA